MDELEEQFGLPREEEKEPLKVTSPQTTEEPKKPAEPQEQKPLETLYKYQLIRRVKEELPRVDKKQLRLLGLLRDLSEFVEATI